MIELGKHSPLAQSLTSRIDAFEATCAHFPLGSFLSFKLHEIPYLNRRQMYLLRPGPEGNFVNLMPPVSRSQGSWDSPSGLSGARNPSDLGNMLHGVR